MILKWSFDTQCADSSQSLSRRGGVRETQEFGEELKDPGKDLSSCICVFKVCMTVQLCVKRKQRQRYRLYL